MPGTESRLKQNGSNAPLGELNSFQRVMVFQVRKKGMITVYGEGGATARNGELRGRGNDNGGEAESLGDALHIRDH